MQNPMEASSFLVISSDTEGVTRVRTSLYGHQMTQEVVEALHLPALLVNADERIDASNESSRNLFRKAI